MLSKLLAYAIYYKSWTEEYFAFQKLAKSMDIPKRVRLSYKLTLLRFNGVRTLASYLDLDEKVMKLKIDEFFLKNLTKYDLQFWISNPEKYDTSYSDAIICQLYLNHYRDLTTLRYLWSDFKLANINNESCNNMLNSLEHSLIKFERVIRTS